ncbi:hypothetical protein BD414DRAFT_472798, partial [Trametes punicea]
MRTGGAESGFLLLLSVTIYIFTVLLSRAALSVFNRFLSVDSCILLLQYMLSHM